MKDEIHQCKSIAIHERIAIMEQKISTLEGNFSGIFKRLDELKTTLSEHRMNNLRSIITQVLYPLVVVFIVSFFNNKTIEVVEVQKSVEGVKNVQQES